VLTNPCARAIVLHKIPRRILQDDSPEPGGITPIRRMIYGERSDFDHPDRPPIRTLSDAVWIF
jgi:hypothetical protein